MRRRDFIASSLAAGSFLSLADTVLGDAQVKTEKPDLVIDAHAHAGHGEALAAPWSTYNDPEVILRHAQEAGIDKTIIFPIENPTYQRANEEIAGIVERYPGKFIGFAKHDPVAEAGRIERLLSREVKELGLKGLKLHKAPSREMLDVVANLQIPVLFHPPKVADFHMIASQYPQINFIMAHLGSFSSQNWSEHLAAIDVAKRYPNVYLESSSVILWRYLEIAAKEVPEKLIFGADGPDGDSRVELYKIRLLKLPKDPERKVLGGTIQRLLPA
jgi:predicted TIM-barrel fold metal-dependent hydrolase